MKNVFLTTVLATTLTLSACGGGGGSSDSTSGYQGKTSAATITNENQLDFATAAETGIEHTLNTDELSTPIGLSIEPIDNDSLNAAIINTALHRAQNLPTGAVFNYECLLSGSASVDFIGISEDATSLPASGTIEMTFNNCDDGDEIVMNGSATLIYDGGFDNDLGPQNYTIEYNMTAMGNQLNIIQTCTDYSANCSFAEDFSIDGVDYRIEGAEISLGDEYLAYDVTATVYQSNYGYIQIDAQNIYLDQSGNVCSGVIDVTDATNTAVMQVHFSSCDSMVLIVDGVANSYDR